MLRIAILSCSVAAFIQPIAQAKDFEAPGKVEAVTVYRGQALVTRVVDVPGPAGLHELIVTDLPEQVVPGSLYAESAGGVEVRSVLFRQRPVTQDVREEVRKLDDQIRELNDKIAANVQSGILLNERKALVEKLESFTAPTASAELTKGVLNPVTIKDMATYLMEQHRLNSEDDLKHKLQRRDLDEQLAVLKRQRDQVAGSSARTAREALVFLNLEKPTGQVRLRYLVNNATWSPSYTVRAGEDRKAVTVEYYASIQQMSGEDWKDIAMTLSTATPSLVAKAPALEPLRLELAAMAEQSAAVFGAEEYRKVRNELQQSQTVLNQNRAGQISANFEGSLHAFATTADVDSSLNAIACRVQVLEWASVGNQKKSSEKSEKPAIDSLSVTYQLADRTSLPSRSDRQFIQIASLPMQGDFYKLAVPLLTDAVYDEAIIANTSTSVLLAGPVSTYLGGEFVGHGEIPTVAVGEKFTLGFGIDASLRAGRELLEKSESLQGGNRIVDLTYRLAVENFGSRPALVRVLDRKPMSNGSEVRSTLVHSTPELTASQNTAQSDVKKGILRWDIEVAPQAIATNATAVEYQLRLEYDKQMTITGIAFAGK